METQAHPLLELKSITKFFGSNKVIDDLDLSVYDGEFLTLLGPSGCGKTTLLRLIGGFERPTGGRIYMDGTDITYTAPHRRPVNTVFQQYSLFPHMNVFENVAFGLKMKNLSKDKIEEAVNSSLKKVKMEHFADRMPMELSCGQQQRVSIARAFVNNPKILLLDEPLSALDYKLRCEMQLELKELQRDLGITFVFVTHDQEEALCMSDRVVVLNEGMIEQIGSPIQIYEEPKNLFVANFVGEINVFDGIVASTTEKYFTALVAGMSCKLKKPTTFDVEKGSKIKVLLRPEDMVIEKIKKLDEESSKLQGVISHLVYKGRTIDLWIRMSGGIMVMATQFFNEDDPDIIYSVGDFVDVSWIDDWEVVLPDA
ncbi:MAG: spermidine/putrescine ABC transporter ATP-binding protein PotA [Alphaproteobacteria bacterium]|nr:spermidine/putrescine ABC transporter ATP-binding protein PotA [Alphaproteobacteria bacterium]